MMADTDLTSQQEARDAVEAAHGACSLLSSFDQNEIDQICEAMAGAALRESLRLGQLAHDETGYGIADNARRTVLRPKMFGIIFVD